MRALPFLRSRQLWALFFAGQVAAIILARLAIIQPLFAIAVLYAVAYGIVAWHKPAIALMLIFAVAPFQQSLLPGSPVMFSLTEINMALLLPIVLLRNALEKRSLQFGPIAAPLTLFFLICLLSALQSWRGRDTLVSLIQMVLYLVVGLFIFSSYVRRGEDFLPGLYGVLGVAAFFAINMLVQRTNYVLGLHKNGVGASLACAFLIGVELWFASRSLRHKRWILGILIVIVAGLLYSLSRGAWVGGLLGLIWIIAMRGEWKLLFRGALLFLPIIALGWSTIPQSEREYATGFGRERWNINERYRSVEFARENWEKNPVLGVGVGLREEYDATNVAWTTLAETGVLGLLAFALVHIVFLYSMRKYLKFVPRDGILYSLIIIGGALMLRQITHGMVDHYWGRGPLAMTWAAVGMAIYASSIARFRAEGAWNR
jgi:hypothetical protein